MGKKLNILRTPEMNRRYLEYKEANPGQAAFSDWKERLVKEFPHWLLIENKFPFDAIAEVHHLLIPRRKFADALEMTEEEREELLSIKKELYPQYDFMLENFPHYRSVADHYHLHLLTTRDPGPLN